MTEEVIYDLLTPLSAAVSEAPGLLESIYMSIPWDAIVFAYTLIFIDYFYGVIVSMIKKEAVSHRMLKGLHKKIFVLFVPVIGILLQLFFIVCHLPAEWAGTVTINSIFGVSQLAHFPICFLLCLIVVLMEFLSFLETSAKIDKRADRLLKLIQHKGDTHRDIKELIIRDEDDEDLVLGH